MLEWNLDMKKGTSYYGRKFQIDPGSNCIYAWNSYELYLPTLEEIKSIKKEYYCNVSNSFNNKRCHMNELWATWED